MKAETYQIIFLTLFGLIGSTLIGFIFFNNTIFIPTKSNFQFVIFGFMGSLFFSLLEYKSYKEQIFALIILIIANLTIFAGKSISITYLIRDTFFVGSLFVSIRLYHYFIKSNLKIIFYLRCFALAFIYGVLNIMTGILVFVINTKGNFPGLDFIFLIGRYGVLIGFGIGLGADFYLQNKKGLFNLLKIKVI